MPLNIYDSVPAVRFHLAVAPSDADNTTLHPEMVCVFVTSICFELELDKRALVATLLLLIMELSNLVPVSVIVAPALSLKRMSNDPGAVLNSGYIV